MTDLCSLTLKEAIEVAKKDGAQPVLDTFAKRAAVLNPKLNAFLRFEQPTQPPRLDRPNPSNPRGWMG